MSYAMSAIEAEQAGAKQLGVSGPIKLNEATGIATSTKAPSSAAPAISRLKTASFRHSARTAARRNPIARKYIQSPSFARRSRAYPQALSPRHEPAPRPPVARRHSYNLLKTLQQTITPQQKLAAPKEITLAVNQLPYKPLRQMAKMALTASGLNLG